MDSAAVPATVPTLSTHGLYGVVDAYEYGYGRDGNPFLFVKPWLLDDEWSSEGLRGGRRLLSADLPRYVHGHRVHNRFTNFYSPVQDQPGLARLHYFTRTQSDKRRQYLHLLVAVRRKYGWRANLTRAARMVEAQSININRWHYLALTDLPDAEQVTDRASYNLRILESRGTTQDDLAQIAADADAIGQTLREMLAVLPPLPLPLLLLVVLWTAEIVTDEARATGPPGDDPPDLPQVADVQALVAAPRPGPLCGVPVAA